MGAFRFLQRSRRCSQVGKYGYLIRLEASPADPALQGYPLGLGGGEPKSNSYYYYYCSYYYSYYDYYYYYYHYYYY